jgi:hypothetical protein
MWLPAAVMSVSPARRAAARSRATSARMSTASGGSPGRDRFVADVAAPPATFQQVTGRICRPRIM